MDNKWFCVCQVILLALTQQYVCQEFLQVSGIDFYYNGEKVFLSGLNIAWHSYGFDFGNGNYDSISRGPLEDYLQRISQNGGNSIRIWIHTDGRDTPAFDESGFVWGTDNSNAMISELSSFLDAARENNILVFPVLWNGASDFTNPMFRDLIWDEEKLESYINNALIPMVRALSGKVSLGGWEIINEPEGSVYAGQSDSNPCFDTTPLTGTGAGWIQEFIPMKNYLTFINRQAAAIHREDPKTLVTVGSWSEKSQTDNFGFRNYYKDECLTADGLDPMGTIDFYQMHSYEWDGIFDPSSPFLNQGFEFGLDKPNVIGEFSESGGDGRDITSLFEWTYNQGYEGAWSWQANGGGHHSDDFDTQARGTSHISGRIKPGGKIDFELIG